MPSLPSWRPPSRGCLELGPATKLRGEEGFREALSAVSNEAVQSPLPGGELRERPVVIIGAGSIIHDGHGPAYRKLDLSLAAIYDPVQAKSAAMQRAFGIEHSALSLEEVVEIGAEREAVFDVAVPPNAIVETLGALPDGCGVLIQKPLGKNLKQAQEIARLCRDKSLVVGVNFQLPFSPQIVAAVAAYRQGLIGALTHAEVVLDLETEWSKWEFVFKEPRIEVLLHSVHYLSLAAYYFGPPTTLHSKQRGDPNHPILRDRDICSHSVLTYPRSALPPLEFSINCNHLSKKPRSEWRSEFVLTGEQGRIVAGISDNLDYPAGVDDTLHVEHQRFGRHGVPLIGNRFPFAFAATMYELQRAMMNGALEPANDLGFALLVMQLCETCYESNTGGEMMRIETGDS